MRTIKLLYFKEVMSKRQEEEVKHFKRIMMSLTDISFAAQLIESALTNEHDELVRKSLEETIVISYSRPFSLNDSKTPKSSGDLRQGFKKEFNSTQNKIHDRVIRNRNKIVAHSDSSSYGVTFSVFEVDENKMVLPRQRRITILSIEDLIILKNNCSTIQTWLFNEQARVKEFLPCGTY